jgi:hypothetical protein
MNRSGHHLETHEPAHDTASKLHEPRRTHVPFPTDLPTPIHGIGTGRNCSRPASRHLDSCPRDHLKGNPAYRKQKRTGSETERRKKKGITCHDLLQKGEKKYPSDGRRERTKRR